MSDRKAGVPETVIQFASKTERQDRSWRSVDQAAQAILARFTEPLLLPRQITGKQ